MKSTEITTQTDDSIRRNRVKRAAEDRDDDPSQLTRRGFCNGLLFTSAALMVASQAGITEAATLAGSPMRIEGAETLRPGSSILFAYPTRNDPAILVRTQDGHFYAYSQRCLHMGCSVRFDPEQRCLKCPCHQGAYDAKSGFVLQGPPKDPLDQIYLQVRGGEVWAIGRRSDHEPLITN